MIRRLLPVLFVAVATVLVFWKVIFHGEFTLLAGGDMATSYFPWFDVASYWLKRGTFLLWDPYVYAGKLNMGEPQPGIFYPLNWLFMLLPAKGGGANPGGLQALIILDYFLAAFFAYRLARSLDLSARGSAVAGLAFGFGGFMTAIYGYLNVLSGFVWMPLSLLFYRQALLRRDWRSKLPRLAAAGACLAASFLPGHHTAPIHTGFLLLLFTVFFVVSEKAARGRPATYRSFVALALTAAVALGLTAFQWLPSALWARQVFRWVGLGNPVRWGERVPYSVLEQTANLAPQDALSLLFPYLSTGANLYTGFIVLCLAAVGFLCVRKRETGFFGVAAVLYFVMSWGRFSALHGWVNSLVPGLWFARELFFYLIPMQLCLALLAGWGLDYLCGFLGGDAGSPPRWLRPAGWVLAGIVLFCAVMIVVLAYGRGLPMKHPYIVALAGLAWWITVSGILAFFAREGRIGPYTFGTLVVVLVLLDLSSRVSVDVRLKSPPAGQENTYVRSYWKMPPLVERLTEMRRAEVFRIDDPAGVFPPNYGDAWRLDATMGHGATALVDYFMFRGTGWSPASNASALLNVRYVVSRVPVMGMERVPGEGALYRNPRAAARAFAASRFRRFADRDDMLRWLGSPLYAPRDVVLLEPGALEQLPSEFRDTRYDDDEGVEVRLVQQRRGSDDFIATLPEAQRDEAQRYVAPFGWGTRDEATIRLKPKTGGLRWFAAFTYSNPAGRPAARMQLLLTGAAACRTVTAQLPPGEGWMEARADLGQLEASEYRLSFVKDEACNALLDSLRITRSDRPEPAPGTVEVASRKPNRMLLHARLTRPSFVVISEVYYPGWKASVDGAPVPLLRGDYVLRTVPVPAGEHTIELRFQPAAFRWGLIVSVCFAAATAAVVFRSARA